MMSDCLSSRAEGVTIQCDNDGDRLQAGWLRTEGPGAGGIGRRVEGGKKKGRR